jgi:hemerythrin
VTIRWLPEYTVFDEELDGHHQQLIRSIQVLDDPAAWARGDPKTLKKVVEGLVEYAAFHFEAEESRMRAAGYPGYEAHRQEHQGFARDAVVFRDTFGKGSVRYERIVLGYLRDWLRNHILTVDRRMGEWLRDHPPPSP